VALELHIKINGREKFAAPYDPEHMEATAEIIRDSLPRLRQLGRVAIFVTQTHNNVAHLIAGSR
jgi:hypothetical protein